MRAVTPDQPLGKAFLFFLVPMMFSNILQALSGTLNNVYLGQMIGVRALASASAFFPILFFLLSFMIGLGAGASVLIGQAWGAKDYDKVKSVAGTTLTAGLVLGIVVAVFGGVFVNDLLKLLGTPADILQGAVAYARIMLFATPAVFVFLLVTSMMRGVGDTVTPLLALVISTITGLIATPAFIRGWFGLPKLDVASGACASVISMFVAFTWLAFYLRRKNHVLAPNADLFRHFGVNFGIMKLILRIGVPAGVQMITISLAEIVLLSLVNSHGSQATAAYGAVNQVMSYVQFPAISIAITSSILGAQSIGAGMTDRLRSVAGVGIRYNLLFTGGLVALAYAFSRSLLGLFITDHEVIEIAQRLLHITLWSSVIFGISGVLSGVMRGSGTVLAPTSITICAIAAIEVPAAYLLNHRIGIDGIWAAYPIAFVGMLAMQASYYLLVWRKKSHQRLV